MSIDNFTNIVIDHFKNPRNLGKMENPDSVGVCGDYSCGDSLTIYLKIENEIIIDISFMVQGCVAAIASSSMATELVKGKHIDEAYKITDYDIADALGGLPEHKLHCSVLGATAVKNAIDEFLYAREWKKRL